MMSKRLSTRLTGTLAALLLYAGSGSQPARATEPVLSGVEVSAAQSSDRTRPPLTLELRPILGKNSSTSPGWFGYLLTATNPTSESLGGRLVVGIPEFARRSRSPADSLLETELWVPANATAHIELPVYGPAARSIQATLTNSRSQIVGSAEGHSGYDAGPLLFDLDASGSIGPLLRNSPLPRSPLTATPTQQISAANALVDTNTGDRLLPEKSVSYSAATLVLADVSTLAEIRAAQQRALLGWVMAGGSLALSMNRPEDQFDPRLVQLLGAEVQTAPVSELLIDPESHSKTEQSDFEAPTRESTPTQRREPELTAALRGFSGGNLHPTPWGSAASYGLGEVHLLGFSPNRGLFRGSSFARDRMLTLMAHAHKRREHIALPLGRTAPNDPRHETIRQELDPNAENHLALLVSTILLLLFALLAGPVNFQTASNAGKPLHAVWRLPFWSLGALGLVLLIGVVSRGNNTKSRHLTLVEAGAGMSLASSVSFRAFNAPSFERLTIASTAPDHVLALAARDNVTGRLLTDQSGVQLRSIYAKPWKTVLVREDGFSPLGRGVTLRLRDGELLVKNRTGRDLVGIIVRTAGGQLYGFDRLADGDTIRVSEGQEIPVVSAPPRSEIYPLLVSEFRDRLQRVSPGLADAWAAIESIRDGEVDWWPADVPALLAQVAGGKGELYDSGLLVEEDRLLLRVIGYGGDL